jgi:hypothetical protein
MTRTQETAEILPQPIRFATASGATKVGKKPHAFVYSRSLRRGFDLVPLINLMRVM